MNSKEKDVVPWYMGKEMIPYLSILLALGTIGNYLGFSLFLQATMRKFSCSFYFFLMFIFDELALLFWVTNRLSGHVSDTRMRNHSTILCTLFNLMYYIPSQASMGLFVLAMFDRLYTSFKLSQSQLNVQTLAFRKRIQSISLVIYFCVLLGINSVLFGSKLVLLSNNTEQHCLIIDANINRLYSIIDFCIYGGLPCTLTLIGNVLILYYIQKPRARMFPTNYFNKREEKQLSIMFVLTSCISFIIVNPYSLLDVLFNYSYILDGDYRTLSIFVDAFGLLSTLTHAINFYLFLITSSIVRKNLKSLLHSVFEICFNKNNTVSPIEASIIGTTIAPGTISEPTVSIRQQHRLIKA